MYEYLIINHYNRSRHSAVMNTKKDGHLSDVRLLYYVCELVLLFDDAEDEFDS